MPLATQSLSDYKQSIMDLLPDQGCWTDDEYLVLTDHTNRLVEFTDGYIEQLPMPTDLHQNVLQFLLTAFLGFLTPKGGKVLSAGIRVRVRRGKYREPDVVLLKDAKDPRRGNRYWSGADLTLEVVSPENPERDLVDKRLDYAEGKVPEYWIVNPQNETITVLKLENGAYIEHGVFVRGQEATSLILPGFKVNVDDVFNVDSPPDDPESSEPEA